MTTDTNDGPTTLHLIVETFEATGAAVVALNDALHEIVLRFERIERRLDALLDSLHP